MKKLLMGASVAALSLTAFQASAQNIEFEVGGFFEGGLGYVDRDFDIDEDILDVLEDEVGFGDLEEEDENNIGLARNAEVIFLGSIVSDNGMTFGMEVQVEVGDGLEDIDEGYMFVKGPFGTFELGEEDGAQSFAGTGLVVAPFASAQDGDGFLFDFYNPGVELDTTGANSSDALKVNYFTPNFSGFAAGVSYYPSLNQNGNASELSPEINGFEVGAGYEAEFGGADLAAGVGWTSDAGGIGADDDNSIGGSLSAGFGGFVLGASYAWYQEGVFGDQFRDNDLIEGGRAFLLNEIGAGRSDELDLIAFDEGVERDFEDSGSSLGLGAAYTTGPWTFGADGAWNIEGPEGFEDNMGVAVGASYALAPGVTTGVTAEWARVDEVSVGDVDLTEEQDAFATGVWMGINF